MIENGDQLGRKILKYIKKKYDTSFETIIFPFSPVIFQFQICRRSP